jgi:hypothetical protein
VVRPVLSAESVTELGDAVRGAVLVAGSHGGIIAAYLGAAAGAHALILNDAGVGLEQAGIAGLPYLDAIAMAAATVSHASARIGDGADALARGVISHANPVALRLGVAPGMSAREAAALMAAHAPVPGAPPPYSDGRWKVAEMSPESGNACEVWALDSVGKLLPGDAGRILLIGSHGALHGGRLDTALNLAHAQGAVPIAACAAVFNDAGVGIEGIGITRLPELQRRGVPAVTVDCMSARIGDGRSMWESGVISHFNAAAGACGAAPGFCVRDWLEALRT